MRFFLEEDASGGDGEDPAICDSDLGFAVGCFWGMVSWLKYDKNRRNVLSVGSESASPT